MGGSRREQLRRWAALPLALILTAIEEMGDVTRAPGGNARGREIQESIARVLMEDWDPIGVRDEPHAAGEYDVYVGGVYRLLASGLGPERVAEHLATIAREQMGLDGTRAEDLLRVAGKLCSLDVRLRPVG